MKKLRGSTGMTQKDFGKWLNIPHRNIQNWEGGQRTPPEYVIELIKYRIKGEIRMFNELKARFSKAGYVLSKNDSTQGYAAAKDIGGGWTDSNDLILSFANLDKAEEWLEKRVRMNRMTDNEKLEDYEKAMKTWEDQDKYPEFL